MKKRLPHQLVLAFILVIAFAGGLLIFPKQSQSGALTTIKDTMSNSRLSYDASIDTTTSSGVSTITIDTDSVDDNTSHLFPGDVICFKNGAGTGCLGNTTYTVGSIVNSTSFTITSPTTTAMVDGDFVVATQSATHTITFVTASSVTDGSVVLKIPARTTTATSNDGFPDNGTDSTSTQGFDLNGLAASDVTCAGGAPSWGAETITSSLTSSSGEHEIICPFTGTLAAGVTVTATLGNAKLINPAPATDHTQGVSNDLQITALEYNHNTPASGVLIDTADTAVAPIESVFVSATVDETLSFTITGQASTTAACGVSGGTDVTTTFSTVPFGTLSLNTLYDAAHDLEISTNATNGYAVTVVERDQMGKDGVACALDTADEDDDCIEDTLGDGSALGTNTNGEDFETATTNGFGYSLDSTDGTDAAFEWDGTSGSCDGAGSDFCARQFPDLANSDAPVTVMSNIGPVNSKNIYVCYRIAVGALQPAGYYYNTVRYTATPTF